MAVDGVELLVSQVHRDLPIASLLTRTPPVPDDHLVALDITFVVVRGQHTLPSVRDLMLRDEDGPAEFALSGTQPPEVYYAGVLDDTCGAPPTPPPTPRSASTAPPTPGGSGEILHVPVEGTPLAPQLFGPGERDGPHHVCYVVSGPVDQPLALAWSPLQADLGQLAHGPVLVSIP